MLDADLESFLSPLSEDAPSGSDLEYDNVFLALIEAGEFKPDVQYGSEVQQQARPPEWATVHEHALALAGRTRDLRVAVWLARSGARVQGLPGYLAGLRLAQGLVERFWPSLHPMLDASEGDDPTARVNALMPLIGATAGLADLRAATLIDARGALTVRDVELVFGRAEPMRDESVPTQKGVLNWLLATARESPQLSTDLAAGAKALADLVAALEPRIGIAALPDFGPVQRILDALAEAGRQAAGVGGGDWSMPDEPVKPAPTNVVPVGGIQSREDAIAALERVCAWLERNEPSNPAPLLIRRSQRLMSKNFLDIIRDLAPETLEQIEKLAGIEHP